VSLILYDTSFCRTTCGNINTAVSFGLVFVLASGFGLAGPLLHNGLTACNITTNVDLGGTECRGQESF